jgi:Protein of unknown function (DUF3995)
VLTGRDVAGDTECPRPSFRWSCFEPLDGIGRVPIALPLMARWSGYATSVGLAGIAGLHIAWGRGSSFPFESRSALADAVVGSSAVPPPAACHAIAAALAVASGLSADLPVGSEWLRRVGRGGVATVLAVRGLIGLVGRTDLVSPGSSSLRFRRLDRRLYAPLCLMLSVGAATAVPRR